MREARSYLMGEFSALGCISQCSDLRLDQHCRHGAQRPDKKKRNQSDELVKARFLAARSKGAGAAGA
jgi:hypothetical protein